VIKQRPFHKIGEKVELGEKKWQLLLPLCASWELGCSFVGRVKTYLKVHFHDVHSSVSKTHKQHIMSVGFAIIAYQPASIERVKETHCCRARDTFSQGKFKLFLNDNLF
jgi:hypothetical protein